MSSLSYLYTLKEDVVLYIPAKLFREVGIRPEAAYFSNEWGKLAPVVLGNGRVEEVAMTIFKGFSWDGNSLKIAIKINGRIYYIGTPEGQIVPEEDTGIPPGLRGKVRTWSMSLPHDFFYQFMEIIAKAWGVAVSKVKKLADRFFYYRGRVMGFLLARPYYIVVKYVGGFYHTVRLPKMFKLWRK